MKTAPQRARLGCGCMTDFSRLPASVPASRRAINAELHEGEQRQARTPVVPCPLPRDTSVHGVHRPVSGLASLGVSPSQVFTQWHFDTPTLAYRCGGSTGMVFRQHAPVSRLTAAALLASGTLHDLYRCLPTAEGEIIARAKTDDPRLQQKPPPVAETAFTGAPYALTRQSF